MEQISLQQLFFGLCLCRGLHGGLQPHSRRRHWNRTLVHGGCRLSSLWKRRSDPRCSVPCERQIILVFLLCLITQSSPHSYCTCRERDCRDGSSPEAVKRHLPSVKTLHKKSQLLGKTRQCLGALQACGRKHDAQAGLELLVPGDSCRRSADGESWAARRERDFQVELGSSKEHNREYSWDCHFEPSSSYEQQSLGGDLEAQQIYPGS